MKRIIIITLWLFSFIFPGVADDSLPSGYHAPLEWGIGCELSPAYVPPTSIFLKGDNMLYKRIRSNFSGSFRVSFRFNENSREGMLYKGLYQGFGIGNEWFEGKHLLGSPSTFYVYQGAPVVRMSSRLTLGYEWKFGIAGGWEYDDEQTPENSAVVSTPVTALMAFALKLNYSLSRRLILSFGMEAKHFSNGNTSYPNAGVNTLGLSLGMDYVINPLRRDAVCHESLDREADRRKWMYDIMAYGAWRKHIVSVGDPAVPQLCHGSFSVVGMQFSPLRALNRYVAIGPALDMQWDEGAGLQSYWVEGSYDSDMKFYRPPFGRQISAGISAHAELTMPIFCVNAGLGYDFINPEGNKRFYQSLTLKTFVTKKIFLNVGYRLGNFKDPQNLMLGVGVRL